MSGSHDPNRDDEIAMWCDLLLANAHADGERFHVTRRAELYMRVAGLPLERVLDALDVDEDGWLSRVAEARASEAKNRAVHDRTRDAGNDVL